MIISESVLKSDLKKKLFKNKWHKISAFVGCVIISESVLKSDLKKSDLKINDIQLVHLLVVW